MEKSVLLVDDKQEIAKIIMLYLSSTYKVSYKENPLKAIAWLQEGNFKIEYAMSERNFGLFKSERYVQPYTGLGNDPNRGENLEAFQSRGIKGKVKRMIMNYVFLQAVGRTFT